MTNQDAAYIINVSNTDIISSLKNILNGFNSYRKLGYNIPNYSRKLLKKYILIGIEMHAYNKKLKEEYEYLLNDIKSGTIINITNIPDPPKYRTADYYL